MSPVDPPVLGVLGGVHQMIGAFLLEKEIRGGVAAVKITLSWAILEGCGMLLAGSIRRIEVVSCSMPNEICL